VLPSGVRRSLALPASLVLLGRVAYADDGPKPADDTRDVFGFTKKTTEPAPRCEDARTLGCVTATDPFDPVSPYALRTWLSASYLLRLPVADARHDDVAQFAMGASRDEAGPSFGGATGLENRWTIEGAPADNVRTGGVETRVPLTFMQGMLVSAGGFAARDRTSLGGTIDVELRRGGTTHEVDAHAWLGLTADRRERPVANATYQLRRATVQAGPELDASVVGTGPLPDVLGGRTWYAAGIAPSLGRSDFAWRAARLLDVDQDGLPDGLPGKVALEPVEATDTHTIDYVIPMMARVGWTRGHHDVALTLIGNANRNTFFLANATQQAAGVDRTAWIGDGIATWKGAWRDTRVRGQLAWHRSVRRESAHDPDAANPPQLLTAYVPADLPDDPILAGACSDAPGDLYPNIPNCPIPAGFFASAGAGTLVDTVGDRPSATVDAAHRIGHHVLRAGGTFEDTRLVTTSTFTGGEVVRSLFAGHTDRLRYLGGACGEAADSACAYASESKLNYRTRYTAAYVEDTFTPSPDIQVDGGMRWELMWVGPRLHFSNELAPRLGIAWDVLGNGQSRWWASMGRSYAMLPAGLGPTIIARNKTVRDIAFDTATSRAIDQGAVYSIAEGIQPAAQDELTTGFEVGAAKIARAGVWVQRRSLRRGLDNVLANPATGEAVFDNPGRDGTSAARRESTVIAIEAMISPSPKISVRASYLYGRTVGTWTGPFDPRQGAALYGGTDWDLDATNLFGRLPTDAGHRAFVEAEQRGHAPKSLGGFEVSVASRLTVTSGRPRNILGDSDLGIVQLLPRGSAGRGPVLSQVNLRLGARWRGFDFSLDVFNVFDRREPTNLDEVYAGQSVRPIVGGTLEDLVFLKNEAGAVTPAARRPGFALPTAFQSPLSVVLGIHTSF
jgi:hypothetical protein